jgi:hypothetical protein
MQGMSERQYAAHVGMSRGAIQKAKTAERLVLFADGSIDARASDVRRAETTDPSKTRKPPEPKLKPVPEAAVAAVGDTLREQGLSVPAVGGGTTYLQSKTANEVVWRLMSTEAWVNFKTFGLTAALFLFFMTQGKLLETYGIEEDEAKR